MPRSDDARFGEAYYRRFYGTSRTRIHGPAQVAHLGGALMETLAWYGARVRTVLEVGAGLGLLRDWFAIVHPKVLYISTEYSEYAAATYGHVRRDIATWRSRQKFDLVVCQGVLPYLSDRDADAAIGNLGAMTRGFLYLEAVTKLDFETVCDRTRTDPAMRFRAADFYRRRLGKHYRPIGGGLYYAKDGPLTFWELETAE